MLIIVDLVGKYVEINHIHTVKIKHVYVIQDGLVLIVVLNVLVLELMIETQKNVTVKIIIQVIIAKDVVMVVT